ncbi:MAG TPA: DinB family protein [bacterium]|jgi:uncharacterized damage-inducible protein DinB
MTSQPVPPEFLGWTEEWKATRGLTYDLLAALPYSVTNFSPHPDFGTLIRQIRHMGDIQACYIAAIGSGKMDFAAQRRQRNLERSKDNVAAYLQSLDGLLIDTLTGLPADRRAATIDWGGGDQPSLHQHLMRLLQHETLHHGMWTFYAKIADLPLPDSWRQAWAL